MGCVRAVVEILRWVKRRRAVDVGIGHPEEKWIRVRGGVRGNFRTSIYSRRPVEF